MSPQSILIMAERGRDSGIVTFIYIALLTIQIVTKQLHNIKNGAKLESPASCFCFGKLGYWNTLSLSLSFSLLITKKQ